MAEEEWAEVRSLALAAHGEWEAEERARREGEAGEAPPAAAMEAQRQALLESMAEAPEVWRISD